MAPNLAKKLIRAAERLCRQAQQGRPAEADLRLAVSTAYYAVFHQVCCTCADALVPDHKARGLTPWWSDVYRSVGHGRVRALSGEVKADKLPDELYDLCHGLKRLMDARHAADYDPMARPKKENVLAHVVSAKAHMKYLASAKISNEDKMAFATLVLFHGNHLNKVRNLRRADEDHPPH